MKKINSDLRNNLKFILLFVFIIFSYTKSFSQLSYNVKNEYGNVVANISWPPQDSSFVHNKMIVYFNTSTLNQSYLCTYWSNYYAGSIMNTKDNMIQTYGVGEFPISLNLIADSTVYNILIALGANKMSSITKMSPCEDTLSFTQYGDTIRTPNFWNCFQIDLDSNTAISSIQTMMILFCPSKIRYAQPLFKRIFDSSPNDPAYQNIQTNFKNTLLGENFEEAWDYVKGRREVNVTVIDGGVNAHHPDLNYGIGTDMPIVTGYLFDNDYPAGRSANSLDMREYLWSAPHGTKCVGFITSLTNNSYGIASIAGKWNTNTNSNGVTVNVIKDHIGIYSYGAILYASQRTKNGGLGSQIISYSAGFDGGSYDGLMREAIDYAHKLGTLFVCSKGNDNLPRYREPCDLEYYKVLAVGNYAPFRSVDNSSIYYPSKSIIAGSNYNGGLDVMAQGDNHTPDQIRNTTLDYTYDSNLQEIFQYTDFGGTSAACPQVAGLASLVLSEMYNSHPKQFFDEDKNNSFSVLNPEDVQGLISISAMDCDFTYKLPPPSTDILTDSSGYDIFTGYGKIDAGKTIKNMFINNGYFLLHKKVIGGTPLNETVTIENFYLSTPPNDRPLLPAGNYKAVQYDVRKAVDIRTSFPNFDNSIPFTIARSWGRGGYGTIGWSAQSPINPSMNIIKEDNPSGYCRVLGDANPDECHFNYNNERDISFKKDTITLQTFCYKVYEFNTNIFIKWVPCEPKDVEYQFTTWGSIEDQSDVCSVPELKLNVLQLNYNVKTKELKLQLEDLKLENDSYLEIYDILGKLIIKDKIINNSYSKILTNFPNGIYLIQLKNNQNKYTGKINVE